MISGTGLASARISGRIGHGFDHFAGQHPGLGQTEKNIRADNGIGQGARRSISGISGFLRIEVPRP
jgi:hypothetical protein